MQNVAEWFMIVLSTTVAGLTIIDALRSARQIGKVGREPYTYLHRAADVTFFLAAIAINISFPFGKCSASRVNYSGKTLLLSFLKRMGLKIIKG